MFVNLVKGNSLWECFEKQRVFHTVTTVEFKSGALVDANILFLRAQSAFFKIIYTFIDKTSLNISRLIIGLEL